MPTDRSRRLPRDPDQPMRFLRVDSSWYENYWFEEPVPRPAGRSAANLATIAAWLRLAFDRMARRYWISVRTGIERVENALRRHARLRRQTVRDQASRRRRAVLTRAS